MRNNEWNCNFWIDRPTSVRREFDSSTRTFIRLFLGYTQRNAHKLWNNIHPQSNKLTKSTIYCIEPIERIHYSVTNPNSVQCARCSFRSKKSVSRLSTHRRYPKDNVGRWQTSVVCRTMTGLPLRTNFHYVLNTGQVGVTRPWKRPKEQLYTGNYRSSSSTDTSIAIRSHSLSSLATCWVFVAAYCGQASHFLPFELSHWWWVVIPVTSVQ